MRLRSCVKSSFVTQFEERHVLQARLRWYLQVNSQFTRFDAQRSDLKRVQALVRATGKITARRGLSCCSRHSKLSRNHVIEQTRQY